MKQQLVNQSPIDTICGYIYNRKFKDAEKQTLTLVSDVVESPHISPLTFADIELLYRKFNMYYLNWVKAQGGNEDLEIRELNSEEHNNFLIAHCSESSCMDDMLYEVSKLLKKTDDISLVQKEVIYQINCYKKLLN